MITKELLEQKYIKEKKSSVDIAKELGVSKKTILRHLNKNNIKLRSLKDARNNRSAKGKEFRNITAASPQEIVEYYEAGHSIEETKLYFGISTDAVRHRLKSLNAYIRKPWEHRIGTKHSNKTKKKMSKTATKQIKNGTRTSHCQGNSYYCMSPNQGRIKVRSSWERDYADYLFVNNINFYYEHKAFKLKSGKSYVPDFYLADTDEYIEIKGYLSEEQYNKYKQFKKEHPQVKWKMLQKEDLTHVIRKQEKKLVVVLCGSSGSGKTWVGNKLKDSYKTIDYDKDKKYVDTIRNYNEGGPILLQLPFKVSTFIRRYSHEFNIIAVSITGDLLKIKKQLIDRGGKVTKTFYSRNNRIKNLTKKYCDFTGDSDQILRYLKNLIKY